MDLRPTDHLPLRRLQYRINFSPDLFGDDLQLAVFEAESGHQHPLHQSFHFPTALTLTLAIFNRLHFPIVGMSGPGQRLSDHGSKCREHVQLAFWSPQRRSDTVHLIMKDNDALNVWRLKVSCVSDISSLPSRTHILLVGVICVDPTGSTSAYPKGFRNRNAPKERRPSIESYS